jgi:hypothetical protein
MSAVHDQYYMYVTAFTLDSKLLFGEQQSLLLLLRLIDIKNNEGIDLDYYMLCIVGPNGESL